MTIRRCPSRWEGSQPTYRKRRRWDRGRVGGRHTASAWPTGAPPGSKFLGGAGRDREDTQGDSMRIVIVGGSGQVGRAVTAVLRGRGHDAKPVSRSTGVDAYTGAGVGEAVAGADAVLDTTRTPSLEEQ